MGPEGQAPACAPACPQFYAFPARALRLLAVLQCPDPFPRSQLSMSAIALRCSPWLHHPQGVLLTHEEALKLSRSRPVGSSSGKELLPHAIGPATALPVPVSCKAPAPCHDQLGQANQS